MSAHPLTLAQLRSLFKRMPFSQTLGLRIARNHRDGVTIECPLRDDLRNSAGVLHGGVTATVADVAVGIAIVSHFHGERRATTVEMKINYFLPVSHGTLMARARLLRTGSTLCVGSVELSDSEHRKVGVALVTYMLLPGK